jgi:hypothetical protein
LGSNNQLDRESVDEFNEELDGLIDEELQRIDKNRSQECWTAYMNILKNAIEEAARAVAHETARESDRHGSKCPKLQS